MTKSIVTRLFIGGALTVLAGAIMGIVAVWIAIANDVFVMNGPDIVGITGSPLAWSLLALGIIAALAMLAGFITGFVAWIGALLNTSGLDGKAWFIVLLLTGIFGFGFVAMIAFVVVGPDGTTGAAGRAVGVPLQATPA